MKKITLVIVLLISILFVDAQSVTTLWENSRASGNLPDLAAINGGSWSTPTAAGTARKFAVGTMDGKERVFVFTRDVANGIVLIYNAENGTYVGKMQGNTTGGLVSIGDGEVTNDGKLIVTNVTAHNADGEFKVYMWDAEDKDPTVLFTYATTNSRYGDNIFIEGNYDQGTAKIYASKKALGYSKVLCWSMEADEANPGKFKFNSTPAEIINAFGTNTAPNVCTIPSGGFYYKDTGFYEGTKPTVLVQYDAAGDSLTSSPTGLIHNYGVTPRYVGENSNNQILVYFRYYYGVNAEAPTGQEECRAELLKVVNNDISQATSITKTPSLGKTKNLNGWGDIVTKQISEDIIEIYVFSAYNGFGKYEIDLAGEPDEGGGEVEDPDEDENKLITTEWEFSNSKGNMHSGWTYRKIAVGDLGKGERVFAALGTGNIRIFDANDGKYVGDLSGTITKTALLAIGDCGVTDDGKLLVSNVSAHNLDNTPFEVYMWDNEDNQPVKVLEYRFDKQRFGDNIFVEGDYSKGTAKIYATLKINYDTRYDVLCWSMEADLDNPGKFKFKSTPSSTINVIGGSIQWAGVSTFPGGMFYKDGGNLNNANATRLQQFDDANDFLGEAPAGIVTRHSNCPKFIGMDGNDMIVAIFRYFPGTAGEGEEECRAEIFRLPNGDISEIESIALTPSLGGANNANGWGSLVAQMTVNENDENEVLIYVSSAVNGFGRYRVKLHEDIENSNFAISHQIGVKYKANQLYIEGIDNPTIEIFNLFGQKITHQTGNTVDVSNLSGIHIVRIKQFNNTVKTAKFIF